MTSYVPDLITTTIQDFTGRTWLLGPLNAWLADPYYQLFVLTGAPGTGKSMVCAWLAGIGPVPNEPIQKQELEDFRSQVGAVHFCIANSSNTSPRALAINMAIQLEEKVDGFGEAVAELDRELTLKSTVNVGSVEIGANEVANYINNLDLGNFNDQQVFDHLLCEPLQRIYKKGSDKPIILVIDALDEAETYSGDTKISHLLSTLAYFPPNVKILATTRKDPRVLQYMEATRLDLMENAPVYTNDVETYARMRLQPLMEMNRAKLYDLVYEIGQKANGVFLYAYLVLNDILAHPSDLTEIDYLTLPEDLYGFYRDWLNREIGNDRAHWNAFFKPFLGVLAIAQGNGLSREQIKKTVGDRYQDIEIALWQTKQFLTGKPPDGPFRLYHRSFVEFLLDDTENLYYHIDAVQMHRQIVEGYRYTYRDRWDHIDGYGLDYLLTHLVEADVENHLNFLQDDRYAIKYLFSHMLSAGMTRYMESVIDLVLR